MIYIELFKVSEKNKIVKHVCLNEKQWEITIDLVIFSGFFFQVFFIQPKHEAPILDRAYPKNLPFPKDDLGGNQQDPWDKNPCCQWCYGTRDAKKASP